MGHAERLARLRSADAAERRSARPGACADGELLKAVIDGGLAGRPMRSHQVELTLGKPARHFKVASICACVVTAWC